MKTVREEVGHKRKVYGSVFTFMQVGFFVVRSLNMHESWLVSQRSNKCVPTLPAFSRSGASPTRKSFWRSPLSLPLALKSNTKGRLILIYQPIHQSSTKVSSLGNHPAGVVAFVC